MKQVDLQGNVYDIGITADNFSDKALEQIVGVIRPFLNEKDKEIERLNNIINELENFMKMQQELYRSVLSKRPENDSEYNTQYATMVGNEQLSIILDKLQELKGSDKE